MKMQMRPTPPMFPVMPLVPMGALVTAAATSVATWRRLRRLENRLAPSRDAGRAARKVLDEHLELARRGDIETDLAHNYHPDVVLLTSFGAYRGHTGIRQLARRMNRLAADATFDYHELEIDGEIGFLRWSAHGADGTALLDGADSYVVRDGRIIAQTIHYRAEQDGPEHAR